MAREELVEGLKRALSNGDSLGQAMQSFYNAGYEKNEVEEAARALQMQAVQRQPIQPQQRQQPKQQPKNPTNLPPQIIMSQKQKPQASSFGQKMQKPIQKISDYEFKNSNPRKTAIIILSIILILLIGLVAVLFVFKDQFLNFFANLFG